MSIIHSTPSNRTRSTTRSRTTVGQHALLLTMSALLIGCATRVEHFTDTTYPPRETASQVEWLVDEPTKPHIELARIVVSSANLSLESLRRNLQDRARQLGADAVVSEVPMVVHSQVGSPYYEPGLFGPAGAAFNLYGYGWYTPFTSNPYLFTQGATDQPRIDHYVSAIAIRYEQETAPTDMR